MVLFILVETFAVVEDVVTTLRIFDAVDGPTLIVVVEHGCHAAAPPARHLKLLLRGFAAHLEHGRLAHFLVFF